MAAKPTDTTAQDAAAAAEVPSSEALEVAAEEKRWPGWPGDNVFRLIVPVSKVGAIIGHKGDIIKKLCEETGARVRVLDGPAATTDRVVLVSAKEEPEAELSPAMDAVLRIFKRVNDISESGADGTTPASTAPAVCSIRLLMASSQAINLIGKHGSSIKPIQESTGATIRVLTGDDLPFYATQDERVVDIQGEPSKVLKALEAVIGHLRKFLVDRSVIRLFVKNFNSTATQDNPVDPWGDKTQSLIHTAQQTTVGNDYSITKRESQLDVPIQRSALLAYGQDPALSGLRSSGIGRTPGAFVTQITQTMQIPLSYAEDIIGTAGVNIDYIRRNSGAVITILETRGNPDEITVEIKGTSTQVQAAQQLVQDFMDNSKGAVPSSYMGADIGSRSYGGADPGLRSSYAGADPGMRSSYAGADPGLRPSYAGADPGSRPSYAGADPGLRSSYYGSSSYRSSLAEQPLGGYGSSGYGGYGSYRY